MNYDRLLRARRLRKATYIFTDLDRLGFWDLELASRAYLQIKKTGLRVFNNPALVKTRYPLLRALHAAGLNDFNIYRADELDAVERFPVFIRRSQGHRAPLSDLLASREELLKSTEAASARGIPLENLIVVEYAAEPVRPGLYRKLSAFRIGDAIVPHIGVHDTSWLVKQGKLGIAGEELYREELELLTTNPFAAHLRRAFEIANIEYGRADFGIHKGRIQIYEINTNPALHAPTAHPSPVREQSLRLAWASYLEALQAVDSSGGWPVRIGTEKQKRLRTLKNLLIRTRKVP